MFQNLTGISSKIRFDWNWVFSSAIYKKWAWFLSDAKNRETPWTGFTKPAKSESLKTKILAAPGLKPNFTPIQIDPVHPILFTCLTHLQGLTPSHHCISLIPQHQEIRAHKKTVQIDWRIRTHKKTLLFSFFNLKDQTTA